MTTSWQYHASRLIACVAVLALLTISTQIGCKTDDSDQADAESNLPKPDVDLPPVPNINVDRPVLHPDGTLTVWGVLQGLEEYLNQWVTVRGYVKHVYVCDNREAQIARDNLIRRGELDETDEATAAILERCNYPHLYIADHLSSERELLVTGYGPDLEARLIAGQQYTFGGRFVEETRGFRHAGQGLIYSTSVTGGNLDATEDEEDQ